MKNIKDLLGEKCAIQCNSEKEFLVMKTALQSLELDVEGLKWFKGDDHLSYTLNSKTVYYGESGLLKSMGHKIIHFKDVDFTHKKIKIETKEKDLRMVFWVPYNISEIQKGIQAGHCAEQYAKNHCHDTNWLEYVENHKTWMIYNGGTTNYKHNKKHKGKDDFYYGSLNNIQFKLNDLNIEYEMFEEPDLNNALSAVCCIIDYSKIDFEKSLEELDEDSLDYFIRTQRFA